MIGKKLDALLKAKGMKPGTLARLSGVSKNTIYSIINRNNKKVDFSIMESISDVLEVPVEYFYDKIISPPEDTGTEKEPATQMSDELMEISDIFTSLSPDNRSKLLELSRLYLNAQNSNEET